MVTLILVGLYFVLYGISITVAHLACVRFGFLSYALPSDLYKTLGMAVVMALVFGAGVRLVFPLGIPRGQLAMEVLVLLALVKILYGGDLENRELGVYVTVTEVLRLGLAFFGTLTVLKTFGAL